MAKDTIDFHSRLAARAAEQAAFDARMDRATTMFKMLGPVIAEMRKLGADNRAIANVFKVIVEELEKSAD